MLLFHLLALGHAETSSSREVAALHDPSLHVDIRHRLGAGKGPSACSSVCSSVCSSECSSECSCVFNCVQVSWGGGVGWDGGDGGMEGMHMMHGELTDEGMYKDMVWVIDPHTPH